MNATTPSHLVLNYDRPADQWTSALPLGNGRLGVMAHGGIDVEHLQVNDGTAWSGGPQSEFLEPRVDAETAAIAIATARELIAAERFVEAAEQLKLVQHRHSQAYLAFADLRVQVSTNGVEATDYSRRLDLSRAEHVVSYELDGHQVTRTTFLSHPHGVGVMTIATGHPDGLDLALELSSPLRVLNEASDELGGRLLLKLPSAVAPHVDHQRPTIEYSDDDSLSMQAAFAVQWRHDGTETGALAATGVHAATIVFATDTTFTAIGSAPEGTAESVFGRAQARIEAAFEEGIDSVHAAQLADHGELFGRAELITGDDSRAGISLDRRLALGNAHDGGILDLDPELAGLLYNFGRYLLIGSSRAGGLPANLQGIWNDLMQPPWSGNYTTNINVQMNYWPAEVANLAECVAPLFDLIDGLAVTGRETANRIYGAPGWVAHHNSDPWAYSQPVGWGEHDPRWAFWPLAGAWLIRHLWEHLLFGAEPAFVSDRAWGPVRSSAEFFLAWLIEQPDGSLGTSPSTSPENVFATPEGSEAPADRSSTLDLVLIGDLFRILAELAAATGREDDSVVVAAAAAAARIPAPRVGNDGMIPEWAADRPQVELAHRHVSHLYFAFPGDTPLAPELADGVSASLDGRGNEATGWSLAWKVALRARLRQPGKVSELLRLVFRDMEVDRGHMIGGLYPNLFAAHPPFQIDGNFGYVAGITEAVVQSQHGRIELLPAIPAELARGTLRGARVRPGLELSVSWAPGPDDAATLVSATLNCDRALAAGDHLVTWGDRGTTIHLEPGESVTLLPQDFDPLDWASHPGSREGFARSLPSSSKGLPR